MTDLVTLTVDDVEIRVPKGLMVVDAAKRAKVADIPVFCYHPKLTAVGMCRMCLVEIGTPKLDQQTRQPVLDEQGRPVIAWMPKLQTACTTAVSEGMAVRTATAQAKSAQKEILEFLLTSHPLDCPICQKGGECPLQNLTLRHGPGVSRFPFDDKMRLDKRKPLGELIFLDEERCIQCARCIRFQEELADDPVLAFDQRGRALQIVTFSDPPFDSKFSGNTTDICPVGALLTADYHHSPRPWETKVVPSICPHCPVGCNLALATRVNHHYITRVMPRQNEPVNEIWICDKGRFGYHFQGSPARLKRPLVRRDGRLVEATWDEALARAADGLRAAGKAAGGIAGDRLSNEDLYLFQALVRQGLQSPHLDQYPNLVGGAELVAQVGLAGGSNFTDWGPETAVLVIASDLEEEAPIWWLRLNAAAKRGAQLVVANGRPTKTDRRARHRLRYRYGHEVATLNALLRVVFDARLASPDPARVQGVDTLRQRLAGDPAPAGEFDAAALEAAARTLAGATNLVVIYGGEGLSYTTSRALAQAAANLLIVTGHIGRPNNGLLPVWPHNNTQGAWDMGLRPDLLPGYQPAAEPGHDAGEMLAPGALKALFIAGADPAGDDPTHAAALEALDCLVVSELFLTATAQLADVVLPAQAFSEREGSYTNGARHVQRFYPAVPPPGEARPDWAICAALGARLGLELPSISAAQVMDRIAQSVPLYAGMRYPELSRYAEQYPDVGGEDLYYGGTAYQNTGGLGVTWPVVAENSAAQVRVGHVTPVLPTGQGLLVVPVTRLYDAGTLLAPSAEKLLGARIPAPRLEINSADAARLGLADGAEVSVRLAGRELRVALEVDGTAPPGAALLPRGLAGIGELRGPGLLVAQSEKAER